MRLHYIQHVPFENPAYILAWARKKRARLSCSRMFEGTELPALSAVDWIVIMGGPMSVYEQNAYPWMPGEKEFLKEAIARGKTVLGICLGAQLIAEALGARVYPQAHKEIGWFEVNCTAAAKDTRVFSHLPETFTAFHWHGDTFELPAGAVHLAQSAACRHQAFSYQERVVALQFHLESTKHSVESLLSHCGNEVQPAPFVQSPQQISDGMAHAAGTNAVMARLLDNLYGLDTGCPS